MAGSIYTSNYLANISTDKLLKEIEYHRFRLFGKGPRQWHYNLDVKIANGLAILGIGSVLVAIQHAMIIIQVAIIAGILGGLYSFYSFSTEKDLMRDYELLVNELKKRNEIK